MLPFATPTVHALRMILLDTNVVSEVMKAEPHPSVRGWFNAQAADTLFLSSAGLTVIDPWTAAG